MLLQRSLILLNGKQRSINYTFNQLFSRSHIFLNALSEESCEIIVEVYVDKVTAPMLNTGVDRLEDILVLHLAGGKDLFVSF